MTAQAKKYLFITGCARSGTTALRRLICAHPAIGLGVERYNMVTRRPGGLTPDLFEKHKFFDLQPGETFYPDLDGFSAAYRQMRPLYDDLVYVGDKQPGLYRNYACIEDNFDGATILYILRNIIDVASSYQKAANEGRNNSWNVSQAIKHWQRSLKNTLTLLDAPDRRTKFIIITYEELYLRKSDLQAVYTALELDYPAAVGTAYDEILARSRELDAARGDTLKSSHRYQIALTAPFDLYRRLHERRLVLPPLDAASPTIV